MEDLNDKINGSNLLASDWNQPASEIQNAIESTGQALTNTDFNQLGKAIAGYVANGTFYVDSGVADAYVLSVVGLKQAAPFLTDGFAADFFPVNDNTGASTVNVGGFGVKAIKRPDGADVVGGDISDFASLKFSDANDWFVLVSGGGSAVPDASETVKGIVELATVAEATAGTDTVRAVTAAGVKAHHDANPTPTPDATETTKGFVELATVAEATTGTDTVRAVTAAGVKAHHDANPTPTPDATETTKGFVELATVAEATTGTDTVRAVTAAGVAAHHSANASPPPPDASTTVKGIIEIATNAEALAGVDTTRAATPAGVKAYHDANAGGVPDASETVKGKIEIATVAEAITGTDTTRATTAAGVAAAIAAINLGSSSKVQNGHLVTADGIIINWGIAQVSANASLNVTFSLAFTTTFFINVGSYFSNDTAMTDACGADIPQPSTTQVRLTNGLSVSKFICYIVIGH